MGSHAFSTWSAVVISHNVVSQFVYGISHMNLKKNQIKFLEWIHAEGVNAGQTSFSRAFLKTVAMKNGMAWAPAWIVKNKSRNINRGYYSIPEYATYVASLGTGTVTTEPATETVGV